MDCIPEEIWYLSSLRIHSAGTLEVDAVFTLVIDFHE